MYFTKTIWTLVDEVFMKGRKTSIPAIVCALLCLVDGYPGGLGGLTPTTYGTAYTWAISPAPAGSDAARWDRRLLYHAFVGSGVVVNSPSPPPLSVRYAPHALDGDASPRRDTVRKSRSDAGSSDERAGGAGTRPRRRCPPWAGGSPGPYDPALRCQYRAETRQTSAVSAYATRFCRASREHAVPAGRASVASPSSPPRSIVPM